MITSLAAITGIAWVKTGKDAAEKGDSMSVERNSLGVQLFEAFEPDPSCLSLGISRANWMLHTLGQLIEMACASLLHNMHPRAQNSLASKLSFEVDLYPLPYNILKVLRRYNSAANRVRFLL